MSFKKVKRGLSKIFRNSSSNLREIPEEANENGNHPHNPNHHQEGGRLSIPNGASTILSTTSDGTSEPHFSSSCDASQSDSSETSSFESPPKSVESLPRPNVVLRSKDKRLRPPRSITHAISRENISKRLSLPADIRIPQHYIVSLTPDSPINWTKPLSRIDRRKSLNEIGFGRLESYQKGTVLGEGTYAIVYEGKSALIDNKVALKEIRLDFEEGAPCTAIREISLLRGLKQANIVTLHDIVHTKTSITLVFEYLDCDLKHYMETVRTVDMNDVKIFLFQVLRGLAYCHSQNILHRDLKPQNLLLNHKGELKLADFGLARAKSIPTKTYSNEVVTLWYRPPDVLLGSVQYSTSIDMWGVGCIFYEMVISKPLFPGQEPADQLERIFKVLGTPDESNWPTITHGISPESKKFLEHRKSKAHRTHKGEDWSTYAPRFDHFGRQLLKKFLEFPMEQRISANAALRHEVFRSLGDSVHKLRDQESIYSASGVRLTNQSWFDRSNSRGQNRDAISRRRSHIF